MSDGAMVLHKRSLPERPTNSENSRARAYCACSRYGWGLFGYFSLIYHLSPLSFCLWEKARYRLKYCLKEPLNPKQPTNYLSFFKVWSHVKSAPHLEMQTESY